MSDLVLSKSRMKAFIQCPEKYRLGYVLEIQPLLASSGLLEGILIHQLVELCLTKRKWNRKTLETEAVDCWAGHKWHETDYESHEAMKQAMATCIDQVDAFVKDIRIRPELG